MAKATEWHILPCSSYSVEPRNDVDGLCWVIVCEACHLCSLGWKRKLVEKTQNDFSESLISPWWVFLTAISTNIMSPFDRTILIRILVDGKWKISIWQRSRTYSYLPLASGFHLVQFKFAIIETVIGVTSKKWKKYKKVHCHAKSASMDYNFQFFPSNSASRSGKLYDSTPLLLLR